MKKENQKNPDLDVQAEINAYIGHKFTHTDLDMIADYGRKYPEMNSTYLNLVGEQYLTFVKKNLDYGPDNISFGTKLESQKEIEFSLKAVFVRIYDKINRLKNLVYMNSNKNPYVKDESVDDTYGDLANYAIFSRMILRGKWNK